MCQNNAPAPDMTMVVDNNIRVIRQYDVVEAVSMLGVAADHFNQLEALFITVLTLIKTGQHGQVRQLLEVGQQLAWDKFIYFSDFECEFKGRLQIADLDNQGAVA